MRKALTRRLRSVYKNSRINNKDITVSKFAKIISNVYTSLTEDKKSKTYYSNDENAIQTRIRSAVYLLFLDLVNSNCDIELSQVFSERFKELTEDLKFDSVMKIKIFNPIKLSDYSYFILRRSSERFICQAMIETLIKDFKSCNEEFEQYFAEIVQRRHEKLKVDHFYFCKYLFYRRIILRNQKTKCLRTILIIKWSARLHCIPKMKSLLLKR